MNPIIFEQKDNAFTTNGLGRITSATRCLVSEELSGAGGAYEIEFDCPIDDKHYNDLRVGRQIAAAVSDGTLQPFRINSISRPIKGVVTVHGYHRSYDTKKIAVLPGISILRSPAELWEYARTHSVGDNPFTFTSEITQQIQFPFDVPVTLQQLVGGDDPSMIYIYGGELEFDQLAIKLLKQRGENRGVSVRYAKNMTDMTAVEESMPYSAIVPYAKGNNQELVLAAGGIVEALLVAGDYDVRIEGETLVINSAGARIEGETLYLDTTAFGAVPVDVSSYVEGNPTPVQIAAAGIKWLNENKPWATVKELSVSLVHPTANTDPLRKVLLGDTVSVWHESLGVTEELRVVKTVWNVLAERYESIDLGTPARLITKALDRQLKQEQQDLEDLRDIVKDVANGSFSGGNFIDEDKIKAPTLTPNGSGDAPVLDGSMDIHDENGEDLHASVGAASGGVALVWDGDPSSLYGGTYLLLNDDEARMRFGGKFVLLDEGNVEIDGADVGSIKMSASGTEIDAAGLGSISISASGIQAVSGSNMVSIGDGGITMSFGTVAGLIMDNYRVQLRYGSHVLSIESSGAFVDGVQIGV